MVLCLYNVRQPSCLRCKSIGNIQIREPFSLERICLPRRPNTSDSGMFLILFRSLKISICLVSDSCIPHQAPINRRYHITIIGRTSTPESSLLFTSSPSKYSANLPTLSRSRIPDRPSGDLTVIATFCCSCGCNLCDHLWQAGLCDETHDQRE